MYDKTLISNSFVRLDFVSFSLRSGEYEKEITDFSIEEYSVVPIEIISTQSPCQTISKFKSICKLTIPIDNRTLIIEGDYESENIVLQVNASSIDVEIFKSKKDSEFKLVIYDCEFSIVSEYFASGLEDATISCLVSSNKQKEIKEFIFKRDGTESYDADMEPSPIVIGFRIFYGINPPSQKSLCFHISNFDLVEFSGFSNKKINTIINLGAYHELSINYNFDEGFLEVYVE